MKYERTIQRYKSWYAKLIRLYPKPFYDHFGEGMEQTFYDLLRERKESGHILFPFAFWIFVETSTGIIKEDIIFMIMQSTIKSLIRVLIGTGLILLIPLMLQLTIGTGVDGQGFNWKPNDFLIMGILLFVTGIAFEFIARKMKTIKSRVIVSVVIAVLFLLIWVHLAVGIVNSWPFAGS